MVATQEIFQGMDTLISVVLKLGSRLEGHECVVWDWRLLKIALAMVLNNRGLIPKMCNIISSNHKTTSDLIILSHDCSPLSIELADKLICVRSLEFLMPDILIEVS